MTLLKLIPEDLKTISIVGMSKNSGKTVTLNHLIQEAMEEGVPLGMTSIGRDGESEDLVSLTEKPRIWAEENTLIATASGLLALGDAGVELLKVTDYSTPLGDVIIGRVRSAGYIQLAGPQALKSIKDVADQMLSLGARFSVIDGALDRRSSAAPTISDGTILSTGAVISRDQKKVIEETSHTVKLLGLEKVEEITRQKLLSSENLKNPTIVNETGEVEQIDLETALGAGRHIAQALDKSTTHLYIPGSLVESTLQDIVETTKEYKHVEIVVTDGTKVFIPPKAYLGFMRKGVSLSVLHPIRLLGITVNPYAPAGYYFEPKEFLQRIREAIPHIKIYDLMLGGE